MTAMAPEEVDEDVSESPVTPEEPASVAARLMATDATWRPGTTIDLGARRWQPDLLGKDGRSLLHVHSADRLRNFVEVRLRAATDAGYEIHIATTLERLYDVELLRQIVPFDPLIHVLTEAQCSPGERLLAVLADRGVRVDRETRATLASSALDLAGSAASSHTRGKRFEAVLAFLLSQVQDFTVAARNFRPVAEEIDIVVQQRATSGRAWVLPSAPFILVEARNRREGIDQPAFLAFRGKLSTKRQTARIGLMFSATTVSSDARTEELKFATEGLVVVFLDGDETRAWAISQDLDEFLEDRVRRAMLR